MLYIKNETSNKVWNGLKWKWSFITNVLHFRHLCQYIFANVSEVYTLHLSKIIPQLVTSIP